MAINVQPSRFSLLKIDDDYDSDEKQGGGKGPGVANKSGKQNNAMSQAAKKKKQNKKKPVEIKPVTEEGNKGGKKKSPEQWDEWSKLDEKYVTGTYEKDLQEAIVTSKLQYEETKLKQAVAVSQNGPAAPATVTSAAARKREKKKEKAAVMSIEEFNAKKQLERRQLQRRDSDEDSEEEPLARPIVPVTSIPIGEGDSTYFVRIENDVRQIVDRDKKQKDFKKQYEVENAQTSKLRSDLESKDNQISVLNAATKKLEDELQQVKKRNQQLCHILGQGEMKDKTELLLELDELRQVRDDLTLEVSRLTSDLEKERSKSHGLKGEVDKAKAGKHGGK